MTIELPATGLDRAEARRQRAAAALGLAGTPATERFDRITRLARQVLDVETVSIHLLDQDRFWAKSRAGEAPQVLPRELAFCDDTVRGSGLNVVPDLRDDPRYRGHPLVEPADGVRFYAGAPVIGPYGENVGTLCLLDSSPRPFDPEQHRVLQDLAAWVQEEFRVAEEESASARVQHELRPRRDLILDGYDLAASCRPVHAVGGDFYDWYPTVDGATLTVADVMGKGVPAAILAATVRAVLRTVGRSYGPGAAVHAAAEALEADLAHTARFVTLFHASLHAASGELRWVDAGHGLALVVAPERGYRQLAGYSLPLGAAWGSGWAEQRDRLATGEALVAVSDGLLDALGGTLAALGRIAGLVREAPSAAAAVGALVQAAGVAPEDDLTVLVLRRSA